MRPQRHIFKTLIPPFIMNTQAIKEDEKDKPKEFNEAKAVADVHAAAVAASARGDAAKPEHLEVQSVKTITLKKPIQRGSQTIAEITLIKPKAAALMGIKLAELANLDMDTLANVVKRIGQPTLIDAEINTLAPSDLLNISQAINEWANEELPEIRFTLREANAGELRGLHLAEVLQLDVLALSKLLPRISSPVMTSEEFKALDLPEVVHYGGQVVGFFVGTETPA